MRGFGQGCKNVYDNMQNFDKLSEREVLALAIFLEEEKTSERRLAQPHCPFQHGLKHGRQFARRRIDDLQHLGGGGLLLQRLVLFPDEPRVLDAQLVDASLKVVYAR